MKTELITIHPEFPDQDKIARCANIIRKGGLVVFPTETVYGIAANYRDKHAMAKLSEVKHRSEDKPYSVLISQKGLIANYTASNETGIYKLIDAYWPGPLTVVVPSREGEGQTIGVRMPDHQIALRLVRESQCTFAAPSANIEGNPPPTNIKDAMRDMDGKVNIAIDGGESRIGQGSTVVDLTGETPNVLREGAITAENIREVTSKKSVLFVCTGNSCRSVMAEYLLKDALTGRKDVDVQSAGTSVFVQSTASKDTMMVLQEEGIDASKHYSQPISSILLKQADLIFVMTHNHRAQVLDRVPSVERRLYLLREFTSSTTGFQSDLDIPDPMGQPHTAYKECMAVIKEAIHKIVDLL